MIDPDTSDSVQVATPSRQDPTTVRYRDDTNADGDTAGSDPSADASDGSEASSAAKDPDDWVTGDEPMTGPQASYLATLAQQAGEQPPEGLTKSEASDEIERLRTASPVVEGTGNGSGGGQASGAAEGAAPVERPTDDWVTGDEPMTGPQASYLATLAQQAGERPPEGLTKAEASQAIDELRTRAGR